MKSPTPLKFSEFNSIIPIGSQCYTAMALNRLKIRNCAYPFDYCISNTESVKKILTELKGGSFSLEKYCNINKFGINEYDIWMGHYVDDKAWIEENPESSLLESFYRKFERLSKAFFQNKNLLIFEDIPRPHALSSFLSVKNERKNYENNLKNLNEILSLNNKNHILYISCLTDSELVFTQSSQEKLIVLPINLTDQIENLISLLPSRPEFFGPKFTRLIYEKISASVY